MVALGFSKGLERHQMDVTTSFLYAPLGEEVYVEEPKGTTESGNDGKMMRLLECLYGLKKAPM